MSSTNYPFYGSSSDQENHESVDLLVDNKELIRQQILRQNSAIAAAAESSSTMSTPMEDETTNDDYYNVTEGGGGMEDDEPTAEEAFLRNIFGQIGEQFPAEQNPPLRFTYRIPNRARMLPPPTNQGLLHFVDSSRSVHIGNDKKNRPNTRLWIQSAIDSTKCYLYRLKEKVETTDIFVCIICSRHNRETFAEVRHIGEDNDEVYEADTHYPSCLRNKAEVDALQSKYDRRRSMNTSNNNDNGTHPTPPGSAAPYTQETSSSEPPPQIRPPNPAEYRGHRLVPDGHYAFGLNEKGTPRSRILVRDVNDPSLGRVYSIHPAKRNDYRKVYYCRVCNPKKYAPVTVYEEDEVCYVHEAPYDKHDIACIPQDFDSLIVRQEAIKDKFEMGGNTISTPNLDSIFTSTLAEFPTLSDEATETPNSHEYNQSNVQSRPARGRPPRTRSTTPSTPNTNGGRARTPPTNNIRNRSRSPLFPRPRTPQDESNDSFNYRGRRPNIAAMQIIPHQKWRIESLTDINEGSKLWILSDIEKQLGRDFTFLHQYEGGYLFQCDRCIELSTNRQRTKGYLKSFNGVFVVREGKHYTTCKPFELHSMPEPLSENEVGGVEEHEKPENVLVVEDVIMKENLPSISPQSDDAQQQQQRPESESSLPTPLPQAQKPLFPSTTNTSLLPKLIQIEPTYLQADKIEYYCLPGVGFIFETAKKLGLKPNPLLWTNTGEIFEIKSTYKPSRCHEIKGTTRDSGYRAFSLFLTGTEEAGKNVEIAIKNYFYDNYEPGTILQGGMTITKELHKQTLITDELTNVHLAILCQMLNIRIGVFVNSKLEIHGNWSDFNMPAMLFKKTNGKFEPVLALEKH